MDLGYQSDSTDSSIGDGPLQFEIPGKSFDSLKESANQLDKKTVIFSLSYPRKKSRIQQNRIQSKLLFQN
jgi:hypothetical protein